MKIDHSCCKNCKDYKNLFELTEDGNVLFRTNLPTGEKFFIEIFYCPFCGKKVKLTGEIKNYKESLKGA